MLEKHTLQLRTAARELAGEQQKVKHEEQLAASIQTQVIGPSVSLSSATATYALRFKEAKKLLSEGQSIRAVSSLESDYAAVEATATYPWSNGPVEGHVNRLKTIKRQMYGRAGFDLLRKRVLFYPDTE